ncbi:beta/gamma crystallin-related protein [uncultured Hyphomonas sp.]|uniref:beta/gamma crystallin-related protein n=1 Tax=uncultured Hyphomonas sp. TaxID=225298 RepID=UPI00261322E4|nr:beta/gamma crystallin-related protein [uncultured Hyphomonas sp.]
MFARLIRFGAALALPLTVVGAAAAQYEGNEQPAGLMLFSGEDFRGEVREVFDSVYSLNDYYFNDRAQSVAVLSGAWELCEHSDFTGRCVFIRGDVQDLDWYGLDRELTSVRPIYEYTEAEHGLMFTRDQSGYIRYADNARYGYDNYSHGYGTSTSVSVYHYGYSPSYRSHGYYSPRLGHGPYGFGWTRHGANPHYGRHYRKQQRPLRGHYGARNGAVTLYTDSYERGASLGLNKGVSDLSRYRFNDNISSLQIRSGKWEVCEHANYKGRCQIVDASADRLNGIRLNDNISSIRPVGDSPRGGRGDGQRGDRGGRNDGGHADRGRRDDGRNGNRGGGRNGNVQTVAPTAANPLAGGPKARDVTQQRRPHALPGRPQRANIGSEDRPRPNVRTIQPNRSTTQRPQTRQVQPAATQRNRAQTERRPTATPRPRQKVDMNTSRPKALRNTQTQRREVQQRPQTQTRQQKTIRPQQQTRQQVRQPARPQVRPAPQTHKQAQPQRQARPQAQRQPARVKPQQRSTPRPQPQRSNNMPKALRNRGGEVHKD